jgi:hypothetical protein
MNFINFIKRIERHAAQAPALYERFLKSKIPPGKYSELRGGIVLGKGIGGLYIHNDKGVVLELKRHAEGVALSTGLQGFTI